MLAQGSRYRVIDDREVAPMGDMGVGEDAGCVEDRRDGYSRVQAATLHFRGRESVHPTGDFVVDLRAVCRAKRRGTESGICKKVSAAHGLAQASEVVVGAGDDADVCAVTGLIVVDGGGILDLIAVALSDHPEAVVGGEGPLVDS